MAKLSKREIKQYIQDEIFEMVSFMKDCEIAGDHRSSSEICSQWVKDNAEEFRSNWLNEHKNK